MVDIESSQRRDVAISTEPGSKSLTTEQIADLESPEKQEAYRQAFLEQMMRRSCPDCGDGGPIAF